MNGLIDPVGQDLDQLKPPPKKKKNIFFILLVDTLTVIFFSVCVFVFVNFPSLLLIGKYRISPRGLNYYFPTRQETESKQAVVKNGASTSAPNVKQYPDNTIFIPKIGVQAPIGWDIGSGQIMESLTKNVVHLSGTAKPGEIGNVFITGHSSNYWWVDGDYNTVFALLPQLQSGDEIIVTYRGEFHHYQVSSTQEVKKNEVDQFISSDKEKLTLMTCIPVGTNLKRLLVYASPR